jgi:hypothetical protein
VRLVNPKGKFVIHIGVQFESTLTSGPLNTDVSNKSLSKLRTRYCLPRVQVTNDAALLDRLVGKTDE